MTETPANDQTTALLRVLRGLLRPLVRMMIARGVTAPAAHRLLKRVYVDVAESDFRLDDKPLTDSRIAMLTGVHRKDVRTIRAEADDDWQAARQKSALLATVVGQWTSNKRYQDASNQPRKLTKDEFDTLVRDINTDVRPRTVLDELLNAQLVSEDNDKLTLEANAVLGTRTKPEKEVFFATNVGDHLAAAVDNLLAEEPPYFERALFQTRMTAQDVDTIEVEARERAQAMLEALNMRSTELRQSHDTPTPGLERFRIGVYVYRETVDTEAEGTLTNSPNKDDH